MSTPFLLIALFVVFMLTVIYIFRRQINSIASIVTVIGVLGTFCGIAWGLWRFDTQNIEMSIPGLLEGMMFAFLTSIVGILLSVIIKLSGLYKRKKTSSPEEEAYAGATIDDLAESLKKIHMTQLSEGIESRKSLQNIEKALTGDGDSTVLTQLQKLRTTFSDKQDDLIHAFNEFATQMAENNTSALIEALETVMRDFNTKINEQFGDNFKHLNEAVTRINDWQQQYRQQMEELAEEFRIAAESIEKSREALGVIADRSETIVSASERLNPIFTSIQHQINELNDRLEAFSSLADKARTAFPFIEERLNNLTGDFSRIVTEMIQNSHDDMDRQRSVLDRQSEQLETMVAESNKRLTTETERIFRESTDRMTQQIRLLDTALQEELTKSIESLGSQLTSLSRKFVDDYTPLSEQLRDVVQIANNLRGTSPQYRQ